jgi:hypothetical protein
MNENPLQKYFRQPKIYLSLPSQGKFYPPGAINGDPANLPVFGMSAMDEILFKTPDALFNGEATVNVIKSCIPGIVQPWVMPQIDVDACLVAIRIATYGQTLETTFKCSNCKEENKFDLDLSRTLEYFLNLEYETEIIIGPLLVTVRPLNYKEVTEINIKTFSLRKQLYQAAGTDSDEERNKQLNEIYQKIAEMTSLGFKKAIASVESDDNQVTDQSMIEEWIKNSDKEFFDKIKSHLETLADKWKLQPQKVKCSECETENTVSMGMDNSDFFVKA